jgi:hypothetical protein
MRRIIGYVKHAIFASIVVLLCAPSSDLIPVASAKNNAEEKQASYVQYYEEMRRLAARNTWKGVDRNYLNIIGLKLSSVANEVHILGAEAARNLGNVAERIERLKRSGNDGQNQLRVIYKEFGKVKIKKGKKKTLKSSNPPFVADKRSAIEFANEIFTKKSVFKGWLPVGEYTLGKSKFTVKAGQAKQVFKGK